MLNYSLAPKRIVITKNICVWFDGTLRPGRGHHGRCRWVYDGQVFSHTLVKEFKS